jgi:hypothetical protein
MNEAHDLRLEKNEYMGKGKEKESQDWQGQKQPSSSENMSAVEAGPSHVTSSEPEKWIWEEPAMYGAINRGYDFGL